MAKYKVTQTNVAVLGTELNSLATATYTAASAALDNTANLDLWADFELDVTFAVAPTTGSVDLYLLESLDGTNYSDGGGAVAPALPLFVGTFGQPRNVATAQRMTLRSVVLPPTKWKAVLYNNGTGQAFTASGNTVAVTTYQTQ